MSLLLAVAAVSSAALGVRAECESLASAARRTGAASLLSAVSSRAPTDSSLTALNEVIHSTSDVSNEEKLTFFAPTDAAVEKSAATLDADLLLNHFVDDVYTAEELYAIAEVHAALESEMARYLMPRHDSSDALYLTPDGTHLMVQVTKADIPTCAGMLHLVDALLAPGTEEAIQVQKADELLMKDLSAISDDLQVMGGRALLESGDREARRERLRSAKRRVVLRNRIAKRQAARSSAGGKRQAARAERRAARASAAELRDDAKRQAARREEAERAVAARKAASEARRAAGRMRKAARHASGKKSKKHHKKGDKKHGKKHHKKDRKPHGMDNGSLGRYGNGAVNGRYSETGQNGVHGQYGHAGSLGRYGSDGLAGRYASDGELNGNYGGRVSGRYADFY